MSEEKKLKPPILATEWESGPNVICMANVQAEDVDFLWYPYIPYGKLTIVQGDPGGGKTTLVLRLATILSKGAPLPYDDNTPVVVSSLYQTAEDGLGDTIKPRLLAGEADCSRIFVIDESNKALSILDDRLETTIRQYNIRLAILDPIQGYINRGSNMNSAADTRYLMSHLARVAERCHCAIVLVGHLNKMHGGKTAYRGLGSIDFFAAARSVLLVGEHPQHEHIRVMLQQKSSLAPKGKPIAFELSAESGFKWLGHCDITADELLNCSGEKETKYNKACRIIREQLSRGPCSQDEILSLALLAGISKRTLDEAKKGMRVKSYKPKGRGTPWYWAFEKEEKEELIV